MADTLPTNIVAQTTGHPALHNAVNTAVNEHEGRISSVETRATALEGVATIVGAGRPDIPASMTTAVQAQVAAAPVGAIFSSTDGASVGAWQWQKRAAAWALASGATGWRSVSSLTSGVTVSTLMIMRSLNHVRLRLAGLTATAAGVFLPAQTGFSPGSGAYLRFPLLAVWSTTSWTGTLIVTPAGGLQVPAAFTSTGDTIEVTWGTSDTWPTTLPGTAA